MEKEIQQALLRTIAFYDVIEYAPTWIECVSSLEWATVQGLEQRATPSVADLESAREVLIERGVISFAFGRVAFADRFTELSALSFTRSAFFARKIAKAARVTKWLSKFSSVRFVGIVNTTALGHARHESDIDFFVIVKEGSLWLTRLLAASPYRFLGKLAHRDAQPDAICLSYFISDKNVDLSSHCLQGNDPYFRYWFLSILPLFDDGIGEELWKANSELRALHPNAMKWQSSPDWHVSMPKRRIKPPSRFESFAKRLQFAWFPSRITDRMNKDTSVIVSDNVLKFHVDDAREAYRSAYTERLKKLMIE